jgi:dTDP-L-rhamnose 4-epimerase
VNSRRVLVTGGAGFIGGHIARSLVRAGDDVVVADFVHPAAHREPPNDLVTGVDYRFGDLADAAFAAEVVDRVDAVCHQASMVGLGVDYGDVREYVHHNDVATASLLEALHRCDFSGRIVLASSMVVYGEGGYGCQDHGDVRPLPREGRALEAGHFEPECPQCGASVTWQLVSEDAPSDPRSIYAATKLHQEHLVAAYAREHDGATAVALRYHNVYGPRMPRDTPYAGVASIFRSALERGESPHVFEDGGQTRDFVHVDDVARANLLALDHRAPISGAFNIASGTPHTVLELAQTLARSLGGPEPVVVGAWRPGDVRHVVASPQRAAEVLGFRAEVAFADGVAQFATAPLR